MPAVSAPSAELRKDAVSLEISFFMQTQQPNDDRQQNPEKNVEQKHVDGKNNVVLGAGRDITGDIHIGHVGDNYGPQPLQIEYSIEQTPVLLWGRPIHIPTVEKCSFWTGCLAFLGLLANVLGILGFFGVSGKDFMTTPTPLVWPCSILGGFAIMAWAIFRRLRNGGLIRLFGNWVMRGDANQRLTVGKLCATCPICTGKIMLKPPFKGSKELVGKCEREPEQHNFSFDPTTMSGGYYQITHAVFYLRPYL